MDGRREIIAIDFDETLRREDGTAIDHVVAFANSRFDGGDFVVVYTARPEEDRNFVTSWLKENAVHFDLVVLDKLRFDLLVDDKSVRPEEVSSDGSVQRIVAADNESGGATDSTMQHQVRYVQSHRTCTGPEYGETD